MYKNNRDQLEYDEWWNSFTSANIDDPGTIFRVNKIVKIIKYLEVKNIVDAGCGSGELLKNINGKKNDLRLSGFDVSQSIIERNKKLYSNIDFFCLNLNDSEISLKNKFEMVISCEVIEHIRNWQQAIVTLSELTEKNGYLLITTQSGKIFKHHKTLGHIQHFKKEDIELEIKKNGLQIIDSSYTGWPFMNIKNILINVFYDNIEKNLLSVKKQSFVNKIIFKTFKILYDISSRKKGPQIFILARK